MDNREKITDLIRQYQNGDSDAFNEIYTGTYKLVYTVCYGILRSQEDAEDLTQDSFLTIYEKLGTLETPETYPSWMSKIAANKALDYCRRTRRISYTDNDAELDVLADDWSEVDGLPDSFIEDEEKREIINKVLRDSLSEVQYQTMFLHYFNNLSVEDIAESMECPEGTVKTRLKSARAKFKDALENYLSDNKLVLSASPFMTRFFASQMSQINVPVKPFVLPEQQTTNNPAIPVGTIAAVGKGASTGAKVGILSTLAGKIIIGAVVITGGIALAIGGYKLLKKPEPAVINMNDYLKYSVVGSNDNGRVDYDIDYQAIVNNNPELQGVTVEQLQSMVSGQWNKTEDISNGDELVFSWAESNEARALEEEGNIDFVFNDVIHKVEDLKDLTDIDLYQYVDVSFSGSNGSGKANLTMKDGLPVSDVNFVLDNDSNLRNGDKIALRVVPPDNKDAVEYILDNGYKPKAVTKYYEVTGLSYDVKVTDGLRKKYKDMYSNAELEYVIPKVEISGADTTDINNLIVNDATNGRWKTVRNDSGSEQILLGRFFPLSDEEYLEGDSWSTGLRSKYYYSINLDILSIVVVFAVDFDAEQSYLVYNIDLSTGRLLDNRSLLEKYRNLDYDAMYKLSYNTVNDFLAACDKGHRFDRDVDEIRRSYYSNLSDYMHDHICYFINDKGHVCFVYYGFDKYAGSGYADILFDTDEEPHMEDGYITYSFDYNYQ